MPLACAAPLNCDNGSQVAPVGYGRSVLASGMQLRAISRRYGEDVL